MTRVERRLALLSMWAASVPPQHAVPTPEELAAIAADPDGGRADMSRVVDAWEHVITHLLHQDKFGVDHVLIVGDLNGDLAEPKFPVSREQQSGGSERKGVDSEQDSQAALVAALLEWREHRIADGVPGAELIMGATLKKLVRYGYTDSETIGKQLPGQAAVLADEVAEVIARFGQPAGAAEETRTPPPAPPPTAHRPESQRTEPPPAPPPTPEPPPTPRASPEPQRARHAESTQPTGDGLLPLTHDDFCEHQYRRTDPGAVEEAPAQVRVTLFDGGVRLSFDPYVPEAGKMVIYRVVSGEGRAPRKPELGELIGATTSLRIDDPRPLRAAVRVYQIWCHVGVDQEDAALTNPFMLAKGQRISPVTNFVIHVSEGRISGEWGTFPSVEKVCVYRIPLDGVARLDDPQHQIRRDDPNIDGFVDLEAEPGARYLYRACAEVVVDGLTLLSDPAEEEVDVPAMLDSVDDLRISPHPRDPSRLDLAWTPPALGLVRVFWAQARPRADIGQQRGLTTAQLSMVEGFREEDRIKGPTDRAEDGSVLLEGVPWPSDWPRIYVTPVTMLGEQVRVGATQVEARPLPAVRNPRIIERYDAQIVTFGWPAEAARVLAFVGRPTTPPDEIMRGETPNGQITRTQYQRDGGIIFENRLEAKGCTVVLVPVNYSGGPVYGQPAVLNYPGLHRLQYSLVADQTIPNRLLRELYLASDLEYDAPVAFTMVNNRDRLPLNPSDGEGVYFVHRDGGEPSPNCVIPELKKDGWESTGWYADWTKHRGFFRLFITSQVSQGRKFGVSGPTINHLWLDPSVPDPSQ